MQQKRIEFWQMIAGILVKDLIFIDESGINLALTRLYARSAKAIEEVFDKVSLEEIRSWFTHCCYCTSAD